MVNEIRMKQIEKRMVEIDAIFNECVEKGEYLPKEIREEYRAIADEYHGMIRELHDAAAKKFLAKIDEPVKVEPKGEVPW